MPTARNQLLCEFHCHTTFSEGISASGRPSISTARAASTSSVSPTTAWSGDPWLAESPPPSHVHAGNFDEYLEAVEAEAVRARLLYDLVVIPGLELTDQHADPRHAAHALALGLRQFVGVDQGMEGALTEGWCRRRGTRRGSSIPPFASTKGESRHCPVSPSSGGHWVNASTASSWSTGTKSSRGLPRPSFRTSQAATSTGSSISRTGRPSFLARRAKMLSSRTPGRPRQYTSRASSPASTRSAGSMRSGRSRQLSRGTRHRPSNVPQGGGELPLAASRTPRRGSRRGGSGR